MTAVEPVIAHRTNDRHASSRSGEGGHDRGELVEVSLGDGDVADPEALAALDQGVADPLGRAEQGVRMRAELLAADTESRRHRVELRARVAADSHEVGADLDLDPIEAVTGTVADPAQLVQRRLCPRAHHAGAPERAGGV